MGYIKAYRGEGVKFLFLLTMLLSTALNANFNFGECSGSGTFEQQIHKYTNYEDAALVGTIPAGIKGLKVTLVSDKDVDIRLYGENEDKIVHWPYGILSFSYEQTKPYKDIPVIYSGYNGVNGEKGHEFIEVNGTTPTAMTMKAFGYRAGYATVNYSWTGKVGCTSSDNGTGSFTQALQKDTTSLVGTIPPNVENVKINLTSAKDLDIQLYGADGTAIASWKPTGLIAGATKQSIMYHDMNITWSGYNGTNGQKGHEYITATPKTSEVLVMKVFGYEAGTADVTYSWGDVPSDTTAPVITLNGDANLTLHQGDTYVELGATAVDDVDGNVSVDINSTVNTEIIGTYVVTYTAKDSVGNEASESRVVTVEENPITLVSLSVSPNPIHVRKGGSVVLDIIGTYSDGSQSEVDGFGHSIGDPSIAFVDGGEYPMLKGFSEGNTTLSISVDDIHAPVVDVQVTEELNTTNFNFTHFGTSYTEQIPSDATLQAYDEERFCMIAGQILGEDGSPLQGVRVSIHKHGEYGTVITDANGSYAIPAEGGLQLTVRYTKLGYTTLDRNIQAPVQDWVRSPDVTMLEVDTKVTAIDLNDSTPQVHISTPISDDRGERSTTLVFDGVTKATVTAKDGSTKELTDFKVRATEFKTPNSMPSDLPTHSAYTYCSDLKIDGLSDEDNVTFDAPVIMYVDNFLGFDVGEIVPVGYYDRTDAKWKASDNGVVVKLLDTDGDGKVDALDSNGSDTPNDINGDGDFSDEVSGIANNSNYVAGKTYWRGAITHFTPWDFNWSYGPPPDATPPPPPMLPPPLTCDTNQSVSSYVTKKSRVFHEDIPIAGTDITLHYSSKRVDGYKYVIDITVDTTNAPSSVQSAIATLEVAGRAFTKSLELGQNNQLSFEWDGKNILGEVQSGSINAVVTASYIYNFVYYLSGNNNARAWALAGDSASAISGRSKVKLNSSKNIELQLEDNTNKSNFSNGWTISNHDVVSSNSILRGNGSIVSTNNHSVGIVTTVAGSSNWGYSGDGGLAINATMYHPEGITIDNDGNLYIADINYDCVRKVDSNGIITTVAGNGPKISQSNTFSRDGGLATEALLSTPRDLAMDSDGNLYIADQNNHRIRKVDKNGIITTVAGNGFNSFSGDGGLATEASLYQPSAVAVDNNGNLYISDRANYRIRKVDSNGIISTIAGNGTQLGFNGDGGLATEATLGSVHGLSLDNDGNLYLTDWQNNRIRKIDKFGIITTIAGNLNALFGGDGGLATEASLHHPEDVVVDNNGNLYFTDSGNGRIRKISTAGIISTVAGNGTIGFSGDGSIATKAAFGSDIQGITIDNMGNLYIADRNNYRVRKVNKFSIFEEYKHNMNKIMYQNKNNTADIFDNTGKHLKTIDLQTGNALKEFGYDENNHLITITDNFNNITHITRDANGNPTQITAPNGQVTTLTVDENNDLTEVRYEDNSHYSFSYYDGSLMDTMTDPNGNVIKHNYNDIGRIVEEIDGTNGSYRFLRDVTGNGTFYSMIQPEGETSTSRDIKLANGDTQSTITNATGDTTAMTFSADEKRVTKSRDGVASVYTYGTDSLTHQRVLASKDITLPSGRKKTTTYETTYDGNATHTNIKMQSVTVNGKITRHTTDYNMGMERIDTPEHRFAERNYDINTLLTSNMRVGTLTPTTYQYDTRGRLTDEHTGDRHTHYDYNPRGNIESITDARGQVTSYVYDIMDRVQSVTYPNNTTEYYEYDSNGNMTKRTVPSQAAHDFMYTGVDLKEKYTSPMQKVTNYHYDRSKNLRDIDKPSGVNIHYQYTNGRLQSMHRPEGLTDYTYYFADKVKDITSGSEKFTFTYDGTLVASINQSGVLNQTISYMHNNDFLVENMDYAGASEHYQYDNDGLITDAGTYHLERDAQNGYTTQLTDGTLTQDRAYNGYGELNKVSDNTFTYEITERYPDGSIKSKEETLNGTTETWNYEYDNMGRLTKACRVGILAHQGCEEYTYDANGNRATASINGSNITNTEYTLDDSLKVYGQNTYLYDEDGYLHTKTTPNGTTTYSYGSLGELVVVNTAEHNISYLHNALNQRVAKKIDGEIVEKYLWKNLTTLLAIYDKDDNLVQRFEYVDQRMPVAMTQGATKYYLHYDQVGSLRVVTDDSHNIVKEIVYDTFGNILTDSNPTLKVPFGFAGGLYDSDTKLTRFGYRDYDAYTGKWTAKDPIGFDGGDSNLYGYVLGDPVNLVDVTGLAWYEIWGDAEDTENSRRKIDEGKDRTKICKDCMDWFNQKCNEYAGTDPRYTECRNHQRDMENMCQNPDFIK